MQWLVCSEKHYFSRLQQSFSRSPSALLGPPGTRGTPRVLARCPGGKEREIHHQQIINFIYYNISYIIYVQMSPVFNTIHLI